MWLILAADDSTERKRIALFSTQELALDYIEKSRCDIPGSIFYSTSLLKDCVWAKVVFEEVLLVDPI